MNFTETIKFCAKNILISAYQDVQLMSKVYFSVNLQANFTLTAACVFLQITNTIIEAAPAKKKLPYDATEIGVVGPGHVIYVGNSQMKRNPDISFDDGLMDYKPITTSSSTPQTKILIDVPVIRIPFINYICNVVQPILLSLHQHGLYNSSYYTTPEEQRGLFFTIINKTMTLLELSQFEQTIVTNLENACREIYEPNITRTCHHLKQFSQVFPLSQVFPPKYLYDVHPNTPITQMPVDKINSTLINLNGECSDYIEQLNPYI